MKRKIYLQSKNDLWYLAGALCHGHYETDDYENTFIYKDKTQGIRTKFDIEFILPHTMTLEQLLKIQ